MIQTDLVLKSPSKRQVKVIRLYLKIKECKSKSDKRYSVTRPLHKDHLLLKLNSKYTYEQKNVDVFRLKSTPNSKYNTTQSSHNYRDSRKY